MKRFPAILLSLTMLLSLGPNAFAFDDLSALQAMFSQQQAEYQQQLENIQAEYAQMQQSTQQQVEQAQADAQKAYKQATCPHNYKTVQNRDVIPATCETDGCHTEVTLCLDCGLELESKKVTDTALGHNYVAEVTIPATETEEGVRTYTCSECGDSYTETIPVDDSSSSENKQMRISLKASGEASGDGPIDLTSYSLTLDLNYSGALGVIETGVTTKVLPSPTRPGYLFQGWAESATGSVVYRGGDTITLTKDTTLYAIWTPISLIGLIGDIPASNGGNVYLGGIQWRVIGVSGDRYLLISADVLGGTRDWHDAKNYCDTVFNNFSMLEQAAVPDTSKTDAAYDIYAASDLNNAKIFLLSASEAMTYFSSAADRQPGWWWLRSLHDPANSAGVVEGDGYLNSRYFDTGDFGFRPAFVLNRSSVLFESAAAGGKSSAAAGGGEFGNFRASSTNGRKLTLKDSSRSGFSATAGSTTVAPGGTLAVTYSGAKTGTGEYVSAMLCDASGNPLYYASLTSAGSGTWNMTIPAVAEGSYTLKVFSEQQNGENLTDYAGSLVSIALTVSGSAPATYAVTVTAGENMSRSGGEASQTVNAGSAMRNLVYAANEGYYFPTDYSVESVNGISVTRNSFTQITVSGTPTANAAITLTAATEKTKPEAPTASSATDCTTADNNDGKITGITAEMEYRKSDAESWTSGTGSDITGLTPGTYYVRFKATDTTLASDNQELTIAAYTITPSVKTYNITTDAYYNAFTGDDLETPITNAAAGMEIYVIRTKTAAPAGKYLTGSFTINGKVAETGYFTMPEEDVTIAAVLADQTSVTVDLTGDASVSLPAEGLAEALAETAYYKENGLDLNDDGAIDVVLDRENDTAARGPGAETLTGDHTVDISAKGWEIGSIVFRFSAPPVTHTLTVTAKDKSIVYGEAPASDGVTYEGFADGDTESVLGGSLTYTYNYEQYGNAGEYSITPGGLTSEKYSIEYVPGKLTVTPKEVGLQWENAELTYTGKEQAPTATATGLVNGDTCTVTVTGGQTAVGSNYIATAESLSNSNYKLPEAKTQSFTIGKGEDPAVITPSASVLKGGKTVDLSKNVTGAVGSLSFSTITQALEGCSVNPETGLFTSGSVTGECVVQVTIRESANYKGREGLIIVTVSEEPQEESRIKTENRYTDVVIVPANLAEVAQAVLTEPEKEELKKGTDITVWLQTDVMSSGDVPAQDAALLASGAASLGAQPGEWIDISLHKQVGDAPETAIHETAVPVSFSIEVPERLRNTDSSVTRTFYLLRAHNGEQTVIASTTGTTLQGSSDVFSSYLLAYKDTPVSEPPATVPVYYFESGSTPVMWYQGSATGAKFVVHRVPDAPQAFSHFLGIQVDGRVLSPRLYTARSGSVEIMLSSAYQKSLPAGIYTLRADFDDGSAETKFVVLDAGSGGTFYSTSTGSTYTYVPPSNNPRTGDESNIALWGVLAVASLAGAVLTGRRKRKG